MSRRANCCDHAVMESVIPTVENELGERFETYGIAKEDLFDDLEVFYNQQRRQPAPRIGSSPMFTAPR